jgi:hypothetical protein
LEERAPHLEERKRDEKYRECREILLVCDV